MRTKDLLLTLLVVTIWGTNFSIVKIGLDELPPLLFSALRFSVVAIPAIFFVPPPKVSARSVIGVGLLLGIVKFSLLFLALESEISAGLASLLLQAQVFFTIALSVAFLGERVTKVQLVGATVSFAGFSLFLFGNTGSMTHLGLAMILLAAFVWAVSNLLMKGSGDINLVHFMIWVSLIPPVPLFALSYFTESRQPISLLLSTTTSTWLAVAFVGFVSTLVAFAIWGRLLQRYPAATVSPFALLIPVVGMSVSGALLGESLSRLELAATALVMAGLVICSSADSLFDAWTTRRASAPNLVNSR